MAARSAAAIHVANKKKKKKRKEELELKFRERRKEEDRKLDEWFHTFDVNKSGDLCKAQLKALLTTMEPTNEPSDEAIDFLMQKYAVHGGDHKNGIKKDSLASVIKTFRAYSKERKLIDRIFDEFDKNKSGALERDQLMDLLIRIAQESPESPPLVEVGEGDVDYILSICDVSNTGSILREEVVPALATWRELLIDKKTQWTKSRACVVM